MGLSIENGGGGDDVANGGGTVEEGFKDHPVPSWREQLTARALFTSMVLSVVFNFIVMKLNLTTGVIPSMNVAAGLLGFAIVKGWTVLMDRCGLLKQPFTRQENTVIQTAVVASSGIAFSSGTASYILGMTVKIAAQGDGGNTPNNVKNLSLAWIIAFLFTVSFVGLFSIMPLRKMMITKYKLTYPSGTATAFLINGFHTPKGAKLAKKQIGLLMKSFSFSFVFAAFQWFFAAGDGCGFGSFPTFGPQAFARRFYFDFSSTYVGVGMICPYMVNISLMIGAVFSWGFLWPFIESKKGDWYGAHLSSGSLHGIQGYRVFLAIAMMFGDGIFQVVYMTVKTLMSLYQQYHSSTTPGDSSSAEEEAELSLDEKRQKEFFEKDEVPNWFAFLGYIVLAAVSMVVVPTIFHQLRWYHLLVVYIIAPVMAFCNAYGAGLSDWSLASNYGKIAIIIFSAWVGEAHGGIIAGLAACGVMMNIVSTASDLMQDFKTGYLTLSSPRSMFASQVFGTAVGCVSTPLVFWFFYKAYPIGDPTSSYPAPYALLYRGIALLGVEGISSLPKNCLTLAIVFFFAAILMNVLQQGLRYWNCRAWRFVPSPMCIAIPFYLGGYFTVDMCLGSLILYAWERRDKVKAKDYAPAVASGLICGESLWSVPAALLALGGVKAPMCMKFLTSSVNDKVDTFLAGAGL